MKKNISIDYLELIKDSAKFTWKYKILWVFGFILALFGGGSGSNSYSSFGESSSESDFGNKSDDSLDKMKDIVSSPAIWIIVGILVLLVILLTVLSWYLKNVARVALFDALLLDLKGKKIPGIGKLWSGTHSRLFRIFKYDLFWFLVTFPLILLFAVFLIITIITNLWPLLCAGLCLFIPILIVGGILVSILNSIGFRILLLKEEGIFTTVKLSWQFLKTLFLKTVAGLLFLNIPLMIVGFVLAIASMILIVPVFLIMIVGFITTASVSVFITVSLVIVFILLIFVVAALIALVSSPLKVYSETYMTKFVKMCLEE